MANQGQAGTALANRSSVTLSAGSSGGSASGASILFTTSGGTLTSGSTSGTKVIAVTNGAGVASVTLTLPATPGTVTVTAEGPYGLGHPAATFAQRQGGEEGDGGQNLALQSLLVQQFLFPLTKALKKGFTINGFYLADFQVVIAAVQHLACLDKLGYVTGHGIRNKLLRSTSGFTDQPVNLGLRVRSEVDFLRSV